MYRCRARWVTETITPQLGPQGGVVLDAHQLHPNQSPTTPGNPNQVLQVLPRDAVIPFDA